MRALLLLLAALAQGYRPQHAAWTTDATWACSEGYFRTSAGDTCQRCSEWRQCSQCRRPCNSTADVQCVTCRCSAGWWNASGECVPCPVGSYCPGEGARLPCAAGELTMQEGAVTRLQCVSQGQGATVRLELLAECPSCRAFGSCAQAQALLRDIVTYGVGAPCALDAFVPGTMAYGALRCEWLVGAAEVEPFQQHLQAVLPAAQAQLQALLSSAECMGGPEVEIYNMSWAQAPPPSPPTLLPRPLARVPLDRSSGTEARWGNTREQVAATLVFLVAVGSSLLLSIAMLSVGLYLRRR